MEDRKRVTEKEIVDATLRRCEADTTKASEKEFDALLAVLSRNPLAALVIKSLKP